MSEHYRRPDAESGIAWGCLLLIGVAIIAAIIGAILGAIWL